MNTPAYLRGLLAEHSFGKLLGDHTRSTTAEDKIEHWDLAIKIDIKKIRSVDEFGESDYHWIEIKNGEGQEGWLYGSAEYIAFETKRYWIIVETSKLKEWTKQNAVREYTDTRRPYYYYQRKGRKDLLIMVPTIDLCVLGVAVDK